MRRLNSMSRIKSCQSPLPPFILHGPPEKVCKMMFLLIIESLPYLQVFHVFSRKKSGHVWGHIGHLGPSWAILWRFKRCRFSGATDLLLSLRGFARPRPLPPVPPDDPNCWWASWRGDRPRAESNSYRYSYIIYLYTTHICICIVYMYVCVCLWAVCIYIYVYVNMYI